LPRDKAIATIVRLLETTFMRIGNAQYARENESFGLTTLRGHQVRVRAGRLHFRFQDDRISRRQRLPEGSHG